MNNGDGEPTSAFLARWERMHRRGGGWVMSDEKHDAAVTLGSFGGKIGGYARAAKLSPARRSEIAREAARKRWGSGRNEIEVSSTADIITKLETQRRRLADALHETDLMLARLKQEPEGALGASERGS